MRNLDFRAGSIWMAPMMALLLAGCETPTAQIEEGPEAQAPPPVVRGCEVGQRLPTGMQCEWNIPDADGMISAESRDGRHLSLMLKGQCAGEWEIVDPNGSVSAQTVTAGRDNLTISGGMVIPSPNVSCSIARTLKNHRMTFGLFGMRREAKLVLGEHACDGDMRSKVESRFGKHACGDDMMVILEFGEYGWTIVQTPQ